MSVEPRAELCASVRRVMQRRLISQSALAKRIGVSPQYMSDMLRGRRRLTPNLVYEIAATLAMSQSITRKWNLLGARADGWLA